jgi:hypothetical protein
MGANYQFAPELCELLNKEEQTVGYISKKWQGNAIQFKEVEAYWCFHYLITLIQQGNYSLARKGFIYSIKKGKLKFNRRFIVAGFKIFIFPGLLKN